MDPSLAHNLPHKNRIRTSIYLLPNLITATSLLFGFLAIKYSIDGRITENTQYFVYAAYAIMAAVGVALIFQSFIYNPHK